MSIQDDLNDILTNEQGEDVAEAIVSAMTKLQTYKYPNANIRTDLLTISDNSYGKSIKESISGAISKMSNANLYTDYIETLTETEYRSVPHVDILYGIQDSAKVRLMELDVNGQATNSIEVVDDLRDASRFFATHTTGKYHMEVGKDLTESEFEESMFAGCVALYSVAILAPIETIANGCFAYSDLEEIQLPKSLKTIDVLAFCGTKFRTFDVPKGVSTIGENAFSECEDLVAIVVHGEADSISGSPWGAPNATVVWTGGV